jgi:prepilin-type N-terminal cleavage/methylation domain-containing protein
LPQARILQKVDILKDIKNNARNKRRGFTLTELIIVIAIIVILAGVSVPFIVQYVESAKQLSRMNTARTLYLATQNKLTEYKITGHLKEFSNAFYSDYENDSLNDTALVYDALGAHPTGDEATNESYVRYMSKTSGTYDETNPVIQLLAGSVLDKEVLTKAILVEYNIKTGIVLSVFYSDTVNALVYGGSDDKANVRGARPYTDYETRKQGYYGAAGTGEQTADTTPSVINIYDGAQNGRALRLDSQTETNAVLYAELLVHEDKLTQGNFKLQLYAADGTTLLFESAPVTLNGLSKNLTQALAFALNSPHILYDDTDAYNAAQIASGNEGLEAGYHRIIWVLDYVYGDMTATPQYSIGVKYGAALTDASSPVRAGIESEDGYGAASVSLTQAYPYYSGNTDAGAYNVCSARHLYNIRYNPSASFIQTADIDMRIMGQPRNMAPLSIAYSAYPVVNNVNIDYSAGAAQALSPVDFSGKYVVSGNSKLSYLVITDTSLENVGLFGSVSASAAIDNIQLEYAAISGKQTAGAIAGANNGKLTGINIINSTVAGERTAGGLSGINGSSALISDCIFMSSTSTAPVSTGSSGTAGGITGSNAGQLSRVFYLAVAPVKSNKCYPITYTNSGGFTNALYLSGIVIRPNINPASYNMLEATVGKPLGTDGFYELTLNDGSYIGYSRNTVTDPLELALTTTKYPYPYFGGATPIADGYDWPVVRGNISIPTYYEKYDDNTYGFYYYDTRVLINGKPKLVKTIKPYSDEEPFRVTEAGYGVLSNNKNNVTIRWNSVNYTNISPLTVAIDETNAQYSLYVFKPTQAQLGSSLIPKTITFDGVEIKDIYCLPHFARGLYLKNEEVKFNYIRTPAQMYNITLVATNTNEKTFYQELDLDFSASNAAIGGKSTFDNSPVSAAFYGTYDGSNRTVTNLTISAAQQQLGLFSTNGGTIKNITLSNTSITNNAPRVSSTRTASVGGIAGVCLNGAKLYGCRVDNTCSISNNSTNAQTGTGGIIGLCGTTSSDSAQLMLYNSCSGATVTGSRNTGGVVGLMYYAMSTCYNTGTITSGASSGDVGGVVGSTSAPVSNCYNAGTVSCTYSSTDTGGVAGYLGAGITDSYNIGNVTATYGSVGGIAGYGVGNIANCYNTGIITTSNKYCGGIIGNTSSVTISNCNNTGTIAGDTNYIGGLAGMLRGSITYCNNSGAITAGTYNGGIAGYSDGSDIDYCYNTGSVAGRSTYTGGISGYATNTQIQYCYNTGSLSASSYAGGIAGMMINGTGVLCSYNIGSVYASSSYAGGIVGQERTNTTMNVCYSVGTVSGNSTGMLIGYLNCTKTQAQSLGMDSCYAIDNHNATALIANYSSLSGGTTYTADRWGNNSMVSENWIKSITTQTNPVYPQLGLVAFADPQYMWTLAPTTSVNGGFPINKVFGYTGSTTGLDAFKLDTTDGAYIVSNAYQLDLMRNYATRTDLTFKLDRNICLGGVSWTPIGTLASPFKPVFDGEGFSITGLYVNASSSDYQGLFGYKSDGAIKNLSVSGSVTGRNYVGGIAGFSTAGMEYCYNLASVSGANCAGGVAGHIDGFSGYVYNNGRITCSGVAGGVFGE